MYNILAHTSRITKPVSTLCVHGKWKLCLRFNALENTLLREQIMCWYQCPANKYITHYHVLAPIRMNLKLLYRNSCVLVQSTLQKCTTVWLTGKTQQLLTKKPPLKPPLNTSYEASNRACECNLNDQCYHSKGMLSHTE